MKSLKTETARVVLPAIALASFILAMIWISYFRQRSFDKKDAIHFAIQRNSNLAVALEQYTIRTIRNADAVLQMIRMEYYDEDSVNLQELLVSNSFNRGIIDGAMFIDRNGSIRRTNIYLRPGSIQRFSTESYFLFHEKNNVDSLIITHPNLIGKDESSSVILSRRLNDQSGKFAGVVAIRIKPSTFTSFYAQAQLLPNDILSLIAPDGITYARRTGDKEGACENIIKSPLFVHVTNNPDSFYFAPDAIRGIPTWFSYRKLKDYPVIATVGSSQSDILADFYNRQVKFIIPRAFISMLVVLMTILSARFILQRRKLSERLLQEQKKYEHLLTEQIIAAQEREREWIGRELHDNVSQVLTTVKLYLEMASRQIENPLIPRSMQLINSSITEIRNLSHQLSAPTLGTRSLIDSINALIENLAFTTNLEFEFDYAGYNTRVVMNQKLALYRIVQEQLNNIVRHADATRICITLFQDNGNTVLTVMDNGKGFDSSLKTEGMGLNNIISRARVFGGVVQIDSAPGAGCLLKVEMPSVSLETKPCYN